MIASLTEVLHPLVGYKMPVRVHFHISQLTSKLVSQNIMSYLRFLLFFFVLLASLQLTSADCSRRCRGPPEVSWAAWTKCMSCWGRRWSHLDNYDDQLTTAMTTAMTMTTTTTKELHQDFSKIILCDFRVSFVSQINWQPIGKLLFMINLGHIRAGWWYNNTDKPVSVSVVNDKNQPSC